MYISGPAPKTKKKTRPERKHVRMMWWWQLSSRPLKVRKSQDEIFLVIITPKILIEIFIGFPSPVCNNCSWPVTDFGNKGPLKVQNMSSRCTSSPVGKIKIVSILPLPSVPVWLKIRYLIKCLTLFKPWINERKKKKNLFSHFGKSETSLNRKIFLKLNVLKSKKYCITKNHNHIAEAKI